MMRTPGLRKKVDDLDTAMSGDLSKLVALMAAKEALLESRGERRGKDQPRLSDDKGRLRLDA